MISEATFSKRFTSFWNELLPNAKHYTRLVNAGRLIPTHRPLTPPARRQNVALVNVLAFALYRDLVHARIGAAAVDPRHYFASDRFAELLAQSEAYLRRFGNHQPYELPLDGQEFEHVIELARLLDARYGYILNPVLDPKFDGCGFINPAVGDIHIADTLIEVKSGERLFGVSDFRQIVVYCTLNHYSRSPLAIEKMQIFNPRMGVLFAEDIEQLAIDLSALSAIELFAEVRRFISDVNFVETIDS